MKVTVLDSGSAKSKKHDCLIFGVRPDEKGNVDYESHLKGLDKRTRTKIAETAKIEGFEAKAGDSFSYLMTKDSPRRVVLVGMGDKAVLETLRIFGGNVHKASESVRSKKTIVIVPEFENLDPSQALGAALEGAHLAAYRFDRYLSTPAKQYTKEIAFESSLTKSLASAVKKRASAIADGVQLTRDLVNDCPGSLNPVAFAEEAKKVGEETGIKVTVLDEKALVKEDMGLMLAVSAASMPYTPPRLVKLVYTPEGKARKHIALVGKGLTFDSGGLDIKPPSGMLGMKIDMAGAGAVLGAMRAIAKIKPDVKVTAILGCVENGIGGNAYHPSDVIKSRKGVTVEVNNTDAEGRLVLADCIDYVLTKDKPDVLVDLATLTGACMVAVGPLTGGLFSDDDALAQDIKSAGARAGEDFWRLPLNNDLRYQLKSDIADTKNTGERMGGAITAALFLQTFVDDRAQWAHLDIAGPVMSSRGNAYTPKGATGFAVRTLVGVCAQ